MTKQILILLAVFTSLNIFGKAMELPVVPKPQSVTVSEGSYSLKDNVKINIVSVNGSEADFTAGLIAETIKDYCKAKSSIVKQNNTLKGINLVLDAGYKASGAKENNEAYSLIISKSGVEIKAASVKGIFYGAMSLVQMIEKYGGKLPCAQITDYPDMKVRAISDDISRGQVSTLDNFKKIIRHMARYKMNVYMPYLEDMLKFDAFPTIGVNRGALTKDEVKELVSYAGKYFVEIIPIFQTLGHYENILAQPEFLKYAEFPGAASLNVSFDSTYIFLEAMLKEVFEMFPSEYINMGADESYDVGLGKSKQLVEQSNIAIVHANHYKKVYDICKKYNKKVIMYGDILLSHPEILGLIPKDIKIVDWHYRGETDYSSAKTFAKAGFEYYVSPSSWNFLTTFPANLNAFPNIKYIIKAGLENGSTGMVNSNWGDYGAETFKELILFGYAWSAQCSWNLAGSDAGKFAIDYFADFFGSDDGRLPTMYENLGNPFNLMMWHEVWRHPLLPQRETMFWEAKMSPVGRINWIEYSTPSLLKNIEAAEKLAVKNKDHLELLKFIAKLNLWFRTKIETQAALQNLLKKSESDAKPVIELIDKNISDLRMLKSEYKQLWLKYYKPDNLWMIEDKFERLINYFTEVKTKLEDKDELVSPLIASKWIYTQSDNDTTLSREASFKKTFNLEEVPSSAQLQLMGDTYAKLYINGQFIDEVYARRSLSLLGDYKRVKLIDVAKYLKKGENIIEAEVKNYNKTGSAGINIISQIITPKGKLDILTDDTWQAKNNGGGWKGIIIKAYPYEVIAPDFATKRSSWIER
jgi:hypothetical protein